MKFFEGDLADLSFTDYSIEMDPHCDHENVLEEQLRAQLEEEVQNNWRTQEEADVIMYRFHSDRVMLLGDISLRAS